MSTESRWSFTGIIAALVIPVICVIGAIIAGIVLALV